MKKKTVFNKKNNITIRFSILFLTLIVYQLSFSCQKKKNDLTIAKTSKTTNSKTVNFSPVYAEIPDANFKTYLKTIVPDAFTTDNKFISNHSSVVSYDKRINVNGRNINSLSGIEYFTALTRLDCMENQLKILDISKNTNLKELFCGYNQLTKLDVSKNANLSIIHCYNNQLTNLDISKNNNLKELNCCYNQIFTINLGKNEVLRKIFCPYNQLTLLDVSKNIALVELNCINNPSNKIVIINPNRLKRLYIDSYSKCNHPSIKTFKDEGGELFDSFFQSIPPFSCNN